MARIAQLTYVDGTTALIPITMRATCKAEEHALNEEWGNANTSPIRFGLYAVYAALRMRGDSLPPFDAWLDKVDGFEMAKPKDSEETENPTI